MKLILSRWALALAVVSTFAFANLPATSVEDRYDCEIKEAYDVEADGLLHAGRWGGKPRGAKFVVSRLTGQVIGDWVPTAVATETAVLQHGDSEWGFQAIAKFRRGPGTNIQTIHINEFVVGSAKPFIATSHGGVGIVTGICVGK